MSDENAIGLYGKIEPIRKPADQEIGGNAVSLTEAQGVSGDNRQETQKEPRQRKPRRRAPQDRRSRR